MSKGGRLSRLFPKLFKSDKDKPTANGELKGPVCVILYLDDTEQPISFKTNWKGQVLFDLVCDQVNIFEKDYFGLRFVDITGQTHWVDHGKSLSSQLKGCTLPHKFYFCVKFYAADPCKLKEEITRYLFFLQVKRDILQGRLPVTFDEAAELCAYAVQSELGDFDPRANTIGYVSEFSFVPNQTEELENRIVAMHRRCLGATPLMAEHRFLEKSKWLEMYGVDLHPVQGESNVEYFLGLTPTGIVVYKHKTKVACYFWPRVTKASHKSKIFMIKVKDKSNDEHVYAFELSSKSACKHLWKCCVAHHAFFRLTQAKDKETRPTKVLRSLSNSSHRGRSERQAMSEQMGREEPRVSRVASRRQQRRVNSDSKLNAEQQYGNPEGGLITLMGQPQPVRAPRHRSLPELQGKESPGSVKSAPWESKFDYGMYTSGQESPADRPYHGRHPRAVSGSDSESGISQRKKYFPSRKESDNESDGSASRRRRREMDSDSGSEVSFSNSNPGKRHSTGKDHNRNDLPLLYPFQDKTKNGSIPSLHSAPVGESKQHRRRRRRSKSPGNSKQFPQELKQHIEFNLIDTEGMSQEQLQDITYTKVETKNNLFRVKYSPKFRQKIWASRRKSFGDADRQSDPASKGSGTLGRQNSQHTDPGVTYGGYTTTHGGSSMDEKPPPYNSVHISSENHYNDSNPVDKRQSGLPQLSNQSYGSPGDYKGSRGNYSHQQSTSQYSQADNNYSSSQNNYHSPAYYKDNEGTVSSQKSNANVSGRSSQQGYGNQRQNRNSYSRNSDYGRQTPNRNLYHDFQEAATTSRSPGESASSPSVHSIGVTANSSQTNTPPRSQHTNYHQQSSSRSSYASHSQVTHPRPHQVTPPKSNQSPFLHQITPPRSHQTTPPRSQLQTPPRSQYSPQSQVRGGNSMRGGPGNRHTGHQSYGQYEFSPQTPNYSQGHPDNGHMRGHSGQSASSSGYSGSHSYQSNGTPSGVSPQQPRSGNHTTPYTSQHSTNNSAYSHRQGTNMDQRQRQNHHHSQAYTSTPRRVYRSDLVTEL